MQNESHVSVTLIPVNLGLFPEESVIENVSAGSFDSGPRGSLRSFKVWSPVFVTVATTFKFLTPSTVSGPATFKESPGSAATSNADATRERRVAKTVLANILTDEKTL